MLCHAICLQKGVLVPLGNMHWQGVKFKPDSDEQNLVPKTPDAPYSQLNFSQMVDEATVMDNSCVCYLPLKIACHLSLDFPKAQKLPRFEYPPR